jgi:hypothetical protein
LPRVTVATVRHSAVHAPAVTPARATATSAGKRRRGHQEQDERDPAAREHGSHP